jgi:hypothetical protein
MALIDGPDDLSLFNEIYFRIYKKVYWAAYGVLNNSLRGVKRYTDFYIAI